MGLQPLEELTLGSNRVRYDALALTMMASGHLCLNLSETVTWETFPGYAHDLLAALGGRRTRAVEAPDLRLWDVTIDGHPFQLVFDDFPQMVSLESRDAQGDAVLRALHARLCGP